MKRTSTFPTSLLSIDTRSSAPLLRQLYDAVRSGILSGRIGPGARLPATRELALQLQISRNTVLGAFDQLVSEGYLESRVGAGTFVASELPEEFLSSDVATSKERRACSARLSSRAGDVQSVPTTFGRGVSSVLPFRPSIPAYDAFPLSAFARCVATQWSNATPKSLNYGDPAGDQSLREQVSKHLAESRGVRSEPEQVIITSGAQQAIDLAAFVLLNPGDCALIEDPGYLAARAALLRNGVTLTPVAIDGEGMAIASLSSARLKAKAAFITPSYQYPLGVTMSLSRRLEMLDWARRHKAWIIEDDYDSEYRYSGKPLAALQGLDGHDRVVYIGTFSKVLVPGLRLGYLVVPPNTVDAFTAARRASGGQCQSIDQRAVADFMQRGDFNRHIRKMRLLYAERLECLVTTITERMSSTLSVATSEAGLHIPGWLHSRRDPEAIAAIAAEAGLTLVPLSRFTMKHAVQPGFLLGFAAYSPRAIRDGVDRLRRVMR